MENAMFHAKDGLYFLPLAHGDLLVCKTRDAHAPDVNAPGGSNIIWEITLQRSQVASIMAFASARGYCTETFYEAYEFLKVPKDTHTPN